MRTMKALLQSHAKECIWIEGVPIPEVGNDDVLIKDQKTAFVTLTSTVIPKMSGYKTIPVPMTCRHEFASVIAELVSNVSVQRQLEKSK